MEFWKVSGRTDALHRLTMTLTEWNGWHVFASPAAYTEFGFIGSRHGLIRLNLFLYRDRDRSGANASWKRQ